MVPPRSRLAVILNRECGVLAKPGAERFGDELRDVWAALGCEADVQSVSACDFNDAVKRAATSSSDAVVVGGGDGSVASAASILAGANKPLGILPLGTFNLAARDVGMPMDWQESARLLVTAPVAEADALDVGGRLYLCVVVLGFYPALMMSRPEYHGSWIVKSMATFRAAVRGFTSFPPLTLRLSDGGQEIIQRTRMALLANNDYEEVFGIIPRRRSLDAGYFTLYVLRNHSLLAFLRSLFLWVLGRWKQDREIATIRATALRIDVRRNHRLPVMMDGEVDLLELPLQVALRPKAVRVIAPCLSSPSQEP